MLVPPINWGLLIHICNHFLWIYQWVRKSVHTVFTYTIEHGCTHDLILQKEIKGWNLIKTLFWDVKWWAEIKFFRILGTQSVRFKCKVQADVWITKESIWETCKPNKSPMTTSYVSSYSKWMDRFTKSPVMLWDATKSMSHLLSLVRETNAYEVIKRIQSQIIFCNVTQLFTKQTFGLITALGPN